MNKPCQYALSISAFVCGVLFAVLPVSAWEEGVDDVATGIFYMPPGQGYPDVDKLKADGACVGFTYRIKFFASNTHDLPPVDANGDPVPIEVGNEAPKYGFLLMIGGSIEPIAEEMTLFEFEYKANRWDGSGSETLKFGVRSHRKGQAQPDRAGGDTLTFPLQHCLNGKWYGRSGRILDIHQQDDKVMADVVPGTGTSKCSPLYSIKFTGRITGDKFKACNLVVCEPEACAEAAKRDQDLYYKEWIAEISPDGQTVTGTWMQDAFKEVEDPNGKLIDCKINDLIPKRKQTYTITRMDQLDYGQQPPVMSPLEHMDIPEPCPE